MRLVLRNGPLRALVDVEVDEAWRIDELGDRTRLTHRLGMRLELCATDLPEWPPSAIREHFTAPYKDEAITIYHSSGIVSGAGEPIVYKLMYLPDGAEPIPDDEAHAIRDSVRPIPLHRVTITTGDET
jgi:hypothetical protein